MARASVIVLAAQLEALESVIGAIEKRIKMQHRSSEASQRVEAIPGIGVIGATAIVATVADPTIFRSGRDFAAWIGLVPRQDSTGGKQKLGPISKQGDRYLRRILVVGAIAVLRRAQENPGKYPWLMQLLARRPFKVVAVALANKMVRMAWALLAHGGTYRTPELAETAQRCSARKRRGDVTAFTNCGGDEDIDAKRSRPSIGPRCAEVPGRKSPSSRSRESAEQCLFRKKEFQKVTTPAGRDARRLTEASV